MFLHNNDCETSYIEIYIDLLSIKGTPNRQKDIYKMSY